MPPRKKPVAKRTPDKPVGQPAARIARVSNADKYTDEDRLAALKIAAALGRNEAAARTGVDYSTLVKWARKFPEQWSEYLGVRGEPFRANLAQQLESLAEGYMEAEEAAVAQAKDRIDAGGLDARDLSALIKAMGSSRSQAVLEARRTRGEPDATTELNINFPQLERTMASLLERAQERQVLVTKNIAEPADA